MSSLKSTIHKNDMGTWSVRTCQPKMYLVQDASREYTHAIRLIFFF